MTRLAQGPWAGLDLREGREDPCRCRKFMAFLLLVLGQGAPRTVVAETQEVVDREVASQAGGAAAELVGTHHCLPLRERRECPWVLSHDIANSLYASHSRPASSCSNSALLLRRLIMSPPGRRRPTGATCCLWEDSSVVDTETLVAFLVLGRISLKGGDPFFQQGYLLQKLLDTLAKKGCELVVFQGVVSVLVTLIDNYDFWDDR